SLAPGFCAMLLGLCVNDSDDTFNERIFSCKIPEFCDQPQCNGIFAAIDLTVPAPIGEVTGPEMSLVCLADFKARAQERLSKSSWDLIEGEADEGITYNENITALKRIRLRPRYLRDVSEVDTRTTIQGQEIVAPIGISPTAFHSLAWPDGEKSTARAAEEANVCYITSIYASCTLEDIVAAAPRGFRWFQLLVQSDWEVNRQLIRRVEALGFKALVITVDAPILGKRRQNIRNGLNLEAKLKDLLPPEEVRKISDSKGIT
ncbi:hypothetical protein A6R68_09845, partial [Neotoma lepida]